MGAWDRDMGEACRELRIKAAADRLAGYVLACRRKNTAEWMEGLCHRLNSYAEAIGDDDRITTYGDGLQVITPQDIAETMPEA